VTPSIGFDSHGHRSGRIRDGWRADRGRGPHRHIAVRGVGRLLRTQSPRFRSSEAPATITRSAVRACSSSTTTPRTGPITSTPCGATGAATSPGTCWPSTTRACATDRSANGPRCSIAGVPGAGACPDRFVKPGAFRLGGGWARSCVAANQHRGRRPLGPGRRRSPAASRPPSPIQRSVRMTTAPAGATDRDRVNV
jgi:hypothetical protein